MLAPSGPDHVRTTQRQPITTGRTESGCCFQRCGIQLHTRCGGARPKFAGLLMQIKMGGDLHAAFRGPSVPVVRPQSGSQETGSVRIALEVFLNDKLRAWDAASEGRCIWRWTDTSEFPIRGRLFAAPAVAHPSTCLWPLPHRTEVPP